MKFSAIISALFLLLAAGCKQPSEVIVGTPDPDQEFSVSSVVESDTTFQNTTDSTGLVRDDRDRFAASLLITNVKYDFGFGITAVSVATAVLEDRDKPAVAPGVYPGIFLGKGLMLNGIPMVAVIRRVGAAIAGWKYIGDLTSIYRANQEYRWNAPDDAVGVIGDSINTPDDLNVISPRGGTVHTRNDDLVIRWTGGGSISIIIQSRLLSTANVAKTRPLLLITPNINRGRLTLNPKILALLPKGKDFVFTFVLANRKEVKVPRYSGKVLLQAASIYNSYVVIN